MTFNFKCCTCNTEFSIKHEYLSKRENVICPSCDLTLPIDLMNDLKELISSYNKFDNDYKTTRKNQSEEAKTKRVGIITVGISMP